jgi:hypothetical protein
MAEELGDEDGGVALSLGAVDPLQRRGASLRAAWARVSNACGARHAGKSERCLQSEARGWERAARGERSMWSFCLCGWFDASNGNGASKCPKQNIIIHLVV